MYLLSPSTAHNIVYVTEGAFISQLYMLFNTARKRTYVVHLFTVKPTCAVSEAVVIAKENQQQIKAEFVNLQMLVCDKLKTMQINIQRLLYFIKGLFQCGDFLPDSKEIDDIF